MHCGKFCPIFAPCSGSKYLPVLLSEVEPQNGDWYFLCWDTSIFLTSLRREAPYLVPYLPTIPTFLVRLAMVFQPTQSETFFAFYSFFFRFIVKLNKNITVCLFKAGAILAVINVFGIKHQN